MKTAEEWKKELHEFFTSDLTSQEECEEHLLKSIKQIQFDAIKHGMTLAATLVQGHWNDSTHMTNQFRQAQRSADKITEVRDNMKEVV